MKWREFFPNKDLNELPYFDGRAVCYPRAKIVRDYLAWRQVDCKFFFNIFLNVKYKQPFV
jgi:tRNA(His) guanylyltransferase